MNAISCVDLGSDCWMNEGANLTNKHTYQEKEEGTGRKKQISLKNM